MKKLAHITALIMLGLVSFSLAQDGRMPKDSPEVKTVSNESIEMKEGKIWLLKDGKTTLLNQEIVLGSSKISAEGHVILKDGTKASLKEGDKVTGDGTLLKAIPVDRMKLKPESKTPHGE